MINGGVNQLDQPLKQILQLGDQLMVGQGDGRLGRQRLRQLPVGGRERAHLAGLWIQGVDQLEHPNDPAFMIFHRHRQEGTGAITGLLVEAAGAGKIEILIGVGVIHDDRRIVQHGIGDDHVVVGLTVCGVQGDRREGDGRARRPAHVKLERVVAQHLEVELLMVFVQPVQGAAIGIQETFGRGQDGFQQLRRIPLPGQRDADPVELVQTLQGISGMGGVHEQSFLPGGKDGTDFRYYSRAPGVRAAWRSGGQPAILVVPRNLPSSAAQGAMNEPVIELRNVSKAYAANTVLRNVNLQVCTGEFLTLLGPSGCGKTTILRLLAGFEKPDSGEIRITGQDMRTLPPEQRHVNTVFQSYALFPHLTVFENVAFGPRLKGFKGAALGERVMDALRMVKLEDFAGRKPGQLSGGQQQRVAIARAVVNQPQVLLLDEPLSALDYKLRKAMQLELKQLQRRLGITFIFVTHDQEEALSMSDRVAVMNAGRIEQFGTPRQIYEAPENLFVARFVGEINNLPGRVVAAAPPRYDIRLHDRVINLRSKYVFGVGDRVNILIRPEDLRIWREDEGSVEERAALFPAAVEEVIYKGSTVDLAIRLDSGELLSTTQFFNEDDQALINLDFREGERVFVDWVHDWETILPHEG